MKAEKKRGIYKLSDKELKARVARLRGRLSMAKEHDDPSVRRLARMAGRVLDPYIAKCETELQRRVCAKRSGRHKPKVSR